MTSPSENIRFLLKEHGIRISNLALSLHKEQERVDDLIRIMDAHILKETQDGMDHESLA